ncbi:MAG TPA: hypothetical protein VFD58_08155 [Blastocatellia bacterium]|nr:hypothetical protein [Blastocatellia bacterium]
MDSPLRTALIFSALPAVTLLLGGGVALFTRPRPELNGAVQKFASGALLGVISVELIPDLIYAHQTAAMIALAAGICLMIGLRWLTGRLTFSDKGRTRLSPAVYFLNSTHVVIASVVIGGGFVVGFREGVLLTSAFAVEALAVGLLTTDKVRSAGTHTKAVMALVTLAAVIIGGAAAGATLLWGRGRFDIDMVLAFGMAALLLRAIEALAETHGEQSVGQTLVFFCVGFLLFLFLAGRLGGRHPDHPGRREVNPSPTPLPLTGKENNGRSSRTLALPSFR